MTLTDIKSQWRESWKSAPVVYAHLVDDPTIRVRQPGFTLPRQQWSLLNRFRTGQGHCGACRKTWCLTDTDLCSCGETQTMSHIVESCPFTKLNGGLSQLHSACWWCCYCLADQLWVLIAYARRRVWNKLADTELHSALPYGRRHHP